MILTRLFINSEVVLGGTFHGVVLAELEDDVHLAVVVEDLEYFYYIGVGG